MANKETFVKNAVLYHTLLQRQSCLDQLIDGLSHYGVRFTLQLCIMFVSCSGEITKKNGWVVFVFSLVLNLPPGLITPETEPQLACATPNTRRGQRPGG